MNENGKTKTNSVRWSVDDDGVGRIVLACPEQSNALDPAMSAELAGAIHAVLGRRPRSVLVTAEGRVFCAGGNVGTFAAAGQNVPALLAQMMGQLHPAVERLATASMPVVSAIGGAVAGAGIGLALCADFVLVAESMKLRTGYVGIGLSPDVGTSYFLTRRVGALKAKQWLLLNEPVDAASCLAAGAVDAVYPDAALHDAAEALAQRLAAGPAGSFEAIKTLCDGAPMRTLAQQLNLEHQWMLQNGTGNDAREGFRAFIEKRRAVFGH